MPISFLYTNQLTLKFLLGNLQKKRFGDESYYHMEQGIN